MIYGGGPFYSGGQAMMDTLRASGFTTVMIWSVHVHPNGDLVLNEETYEVEPRPWFVSYQ